MRTLPMLAITAPVPGMLCVNGRFAGEIAPEHPFITPVNPSGAVYCTLFPLVPGRLAVTRRLDFSEGDFLPESVGEDGLSAVIWPGGVIEAELEPMRVPAGVCSGYADARGDYILQRGCGAFLRFPSGRILPLPETAGEPQLLTEGETVCVLGDRADGGMFLAAADAEGRTLGMLNADRIEHEDGGAFFASVFSGDTVGHARLEHWTLRADGLVMASWQPAWADGAPHWPGSPQETALAAMEALTADLESEAEGYLAPGMPIAGLREIAGRCDAFSLMKYPPADGSACIAMISVLGKNCARAVPLYFRARPERGVQSKWRIEAFSEQPE